MRRWFRQLPVKIVAVAAAGVLTLAFYGLIAANPLNSSAATTNTTSTNDTSTASVPTPTVRPSTAPAGPRHVAPAPRRSRGS